MPSIKLLHYTKKVYSDGSSPVIIQIISGKQIKRKVLASVLPEQWNDKTKRVREKKHPNAAVINEKIREDFNKYESIIVALPAGADISDIFEEERGEGTRLDYFAVAELYLKGVVLKSGFSYDSFNSIINKFKRFINNRKMFPEDFTEKLMSDYINYLRGIPNKDTTINNNLKVLRFPSKWGDENKLWNKPDALHNFKLPPKSRGTKRKLSVSEFEQFCAVKLNAGTKILSAQHAFMIAYYFRGMRISDVLQIKRENFRDGKFYCTSQKKERSFAIKLPKQAETIIAQYQQASTPYLLPFLNWGYDNELNLGQNNINKKDAIKRATAYVNKLIKEIAVKAGIDPKTISTHVSRHTFARDALKKIKDPNITMKLTGHTCLAVHQVYATEILSDDELDNAADDIFS